MEIQRDSLIAIGPYVRDDARLAPDGAEADHRQGLAGEE
jgi:hypothetical protein